MKQRLRQCIVAILLCAGCLHGVSLEDCLFTVQCDEREIGSGFLLKDQDRVWLVSNCHVVRADGTIQFIGMLDKSRTYSLPEKVEVAANRDAVRFNVKEPDGLAPKNTVDFDEKVFAFGNSDGLGVITKSEGKIVGKGRGEIEITCEIIPGNSGGPVVDAHDGVVGIATFGVTTSSAKIAAELSGQVSAAERERLVEKIKTRHGTRYTETRRFAVSLSDAEWQLVDTEQFKQESKLYGKMDDRYHRFNEAVNRVFRCRTIPSESEEVLGRDWVKRFNQDLDKYGYYDSEAGRYYLRSGRQDAFDHAFGEWLEDLSATAERLARELREQTADMTVLYYQNEIKNKASSLTRRGTELMEIAREKYGR